MENQQLTVEERRAKVKSLRCALFCTICVLVLGIVLIVAGSLSPKTMTQIIWSQAQTNTQLTQANEDRWANKTNNDIGIYQNQYFYNCTNMMDVIYANAKPEF